MNSIKQFFESVTSKLLHKSSLKTKLDLIAPVNLKSIAVEEIKPPKKQTTAEKLRVILNNTDLSVVEIHALAQRRVSQLIDNEDYVIYQELTALEKELDKVQKGTFNDNDISFKIINKTDFDDVIKLLAKKNETVLERRKVANGGRVYLSGIISKMQDYEFSSSAFKRFEQVCVSRENMSENSAIVKEIRTLAGLFQNAEQGMFKERQLTRLHLLQGSECYDMLAQKLHEKNQDALGTDIESSPLSQSNAM